MPSAEVDCNFLQSSTNLEIAIKGRLVHIEQIIEKSWSKAFAIIGNRINIAPSDTLSSNCAQHYHYFYREIRSFLKVTNEIA